MAYRRRSIYRSSRRPSFTPSVSTPKFDSPVLGAELKAYKGTFSWMLDVQKQYEKFGHLSQKQWDGVARTLNKNKPAKLASTWTNGVHVKINIMLRRGVAMKLKKDLNLPYGPFALTVTKINNAFKSRYSTKFTVSARINGDTAVNACRICGRTLTDNKSIVSGIGPTCAKKLGALYITYQTDIKKFMAEFKAECDKVGEFSVDLWENNIKEGADLMMKAYTDILAKAGTSLASTMTSGSVSPVSQSVTASAQVSAPAPRPIINSTPIGVKLNFHLDYYQGEGNTKNYLHWNPQSFTFSVERSSLPGTMGSDPIPNQVFIKNAKTGNIRKFIYEGQDMDGSGEDVYGTRYVAVDEHDNKINCHLLIIND